MKKNKKNMKLGTAKSRSRKTIKIRAPKITTIVSIDLENTLERLPTKIRSYFYSTMYAELNQLCGAYNALISDPATRNISPYIDYLIDTKIELINLWLDTQFAKLNKK